MRATPRELVRKVTCPSCHYFLGCITSDGRGPIFDECPVATAGPLNNRPVKIDKCPMYAAMSPYQPKRHPTHISGHGGPPDDDAFGYRNIAVRHLEDAGNE